MSVRTTILFISLFLTACDPNSAPAGTTTGSSFITRGQAIANALKIASASAPEISGALVPPENIQAEQSTLAQALQRMTGEMQLPTGYQADTPVWYVTMDGLWASEVQAPGMTATQLPYHHYFVILDAITGMEVESSLKP